MCHIVKLNNKTNKFEKSTIKLVDNGTWGLLVGSDKNKQIRYALNTGEEYYFLDKDGGIISTNKSLGHFRCEDVARFSKINTCHI